MSLYRGVKALALGIMVYVVTAIVMSAAGALEFSIPAPPPPPSGANPLDYVWYGLQLIAYPFTVLFTLIGFALQVAAFPVIPPPFNLIVAFLVGVVTVYGIVEIIMSLIERLPIPVPV